MNIQPCTSKKNAFYEQTSRLLKELRETGTEKVLRHLESPMDAVVQIRGRGDVIALCSNNYLGLANHPEVVAAAAQGLQTYGYGTASVRFICGTFACHQNLERRIAELSHTEASFSYVSCWNANEAVIATVAGRNDVILSDELNHASIIDGCRLAKPRERRVYRHADLEDLEGQLKTLGDADSRWVITDGVFSMEGSVAPLRELVDLCRKYDARLIVDDSHGVGVLGEHGKGTAEHAGVLGEVDILTGTLGKALGGAAGGYVAGSQDLIDLLIQRSRPSLFSNALPPMVACGARKAIELLQQDQSLVQRLHANIRTLRDGFEKLGFTCRPSPSGIIPIHIGDEAQAIRASEKLLEQGVWVVAFGYPVVPKGTARLRVQVSAAHTDEHLERVLAAFSKL